MDFATVHATFAAAGVKSSQGLSAEEFARLEGTYGFVFSPDLREFLSIAMPVSDRWVDWREADPEAIRERLEAPADGICFDVEHNQFWMDDWGDRPGELKDALAITREKVVAAPVLIPIWAHRYLPATPAERGNPVLSVHQTDIIYYGSDLLDYFQNEFASYFRGQERTATGSFRHIPFWSKVIDTAARPAGDAE